MKTKVPVFHEDFLFEVTSQELFQLTGEGTEKQKTGPRNEGRAFVL
jgi:hypothetical protein